MTSEEDRAVPTRDQAADALARRPRARAQRRARASPGWRRRVVVPDCAWPLPSPHLGPQGLQTTKLKLLDRALRAAEFACNFLRTFALRETKNDDVLLISG